jgi:hypothetical protein
MEKRSLKQLEPDESATPSSLRFYDPEIQNAWNAEPRDGERIERANQEASKLKAAYLRQLTDLSERISKETFSRFSDPRQPLFDADLFKFSVGDALGYSEPRQRRMRLSTAVEATFCSFDGKTLHDLTYSGIAAVRVDVPNGRWFSWPTGRNRMDSLLADELTSLDPQLMKHAFLFASGATISIECKRINWKTRRNRSR